MTIRWGSYKVKNHYDELLRASGKPHEAAKPLCDFLRSLTDKELTEYKAAANLATHVTGITFSIYNQEEGSLERAWPLDIVPPHHPPLGSGRKLNVARSNELKL